MHRYLACQMSDSGFRRPLRGSNSRCVRRTLPSQSACSMIPQTSLTNSRDKRHSSLSWFGPPCSAIPYSSFVMDFLEGLRMN